MKIQSLRIKSKITITLTQKNQNTIPYLLVISPKVANQMFPDGRVDLFDGKRFLITERYDKNSLHLIKQSQTVQVVYPRVNMVVPFLIVTINLNELNYAYNVDRRINNYNGTDLNELKCKETQRFDF